LYYSVLSAYLVKQTCSGLSIRRTSLNYMRTSGHSRFNGSTRFLLMNLIGFSTSRMPIVTPNRHAVSVNWKPHVG